MPEPLPGRLGRVQMDTELPRREDLPLVFDELDYQLACQAYLWALPLVSYAQWQQVHQETFGATNYDLVHYVTLPGPARADHRERDHPIHLEVLRPQPDRAAGGRAAAGPTAGGLSDFWQRECGIMGEMGPDPARAEAPHRAARPGTARRR